MPIVGFALPLHCNIAVILSRRLRQKNTHPPKRMGELKPEFRYDKESILQPIAIGVQSHREVLTAVRFNSCPARVCYVNGRSRDSSFWRTTFGLVACRPVGGGVLLARRFSLSLNTMLSQRLTK